MKEFLPVGIVARSATDLFGFDSLAFSCELAMRIMNFEEIP